MRLNWNMSMSLTMMKFTYKKMLLRFNIGHGATEGLWNQLLSQSNEAGQRHNDMKICEIPELKNTAPLAYHISVHCPNV